MNKSKILNIVIIVLALALIIFLVAKNNPADEAEVENPNENAGETETGNENVNGQTGPEVVIPTPTAESWEGQTVENEISFNAPNDYYISYPVIGDCEDVVSISTQTPTDPTIPVALIYKEGCVKDTEVTGNYTYREVKGGYVFQTNSRHSSVIAVFNQIVASAKAEQ